MAEPDLFLTYCRPPLPYHISVGGGSAGTKTLVFHRSAWVPSGLEQKIKESFQNSTVGGQSKVTGQRVRVRMPCYSDAPVENVDKELFGHGWARLDKCVSQKHRTQFMFSI